MIEPFNWTCPFCNRAQTVQYNAAINFVGLGPRGSKYGTVGCRVESIACANVECLELWISVGLNKAQHNLQYDRYQALDEKLFELGQHPSASRVLQPSYIPTPIVQDYYEACDILNLSPKASATLARRCLQGMIRDFCGVTKNRLIDEIKELKSQADEHRAPAGIQPDIIDAIDAVRKIGNIGAHMEKDINIIVDVDPDEARTLIELLELLFREWYVARHDRVQRIASISAIARLKDSQKALPAPG
jgi:Domain of unknown function (DUF4145)